MNGARCSSSRFSNESLNFKEFDKFGFPATCEGETSEMVYLTNFEMYMNSEDLKVDMSFYIIKCKYLRK